MPRHRLATPLFIKTAKAKLFLLFVIYGLTCFPIIAATIVSNGTPDLSGTWNVSGNRIADDFTLGSAADIDTIRFWFGEGQNTQSPTSFLGTVTWAVFANNSGALGSLLTSGTVGSLSATFFTTFSNQTSYFQVDIPLGPGVHFNAGTYWLELHDGSSLIDVPAEALNWASSSGNSGNALGNFIGVPDEPSTRPAFNRNAEVAFQLFGSASSAVPEPSSWVLMIGAGALLFAQKLARRIISR